MPSRTNADPITPAGGAYIVTPGYFRALGVPLLEGRDFTQADEAAGANVLIINQAMARRYWREGTAVGKLLLGRNELRIVGVVGNVRHDGIAQAAAPVVYLPSHLAPRTSMKLVVRTASDPTRLADAIRTAIWDINPSQPVADMTTLQQIFSDAVARPRFLALLVGLFGGVAALLAALGVYGVIAYTVSRRTREVGIRIALGAAVGDVLRLIIPQGLAPALSGLAVGFGGALVLTRVLSSLLFGVDGRDPMTFALVALLLGAAALLAVYIPAHRAARVDPVIALRTE